MAMLEVKGIHVYYGLIHALRDVSFAVNEGNCYGIIGANGAGKSTFLRIISGVIEPSTGSVSIGADDRMSVLEQDHYKYDDFSVMETVIMVNRRLYAIMRQKDEL